MDLLQMRYITTIASLKNMTKAAEQLHVSQSALSLSHKRLEEELGVRLFLREGRYLRLTDAGVVFCEKAGQILAQADALEECMRRMERDRRDTVRFGSEVIDFSNEMIALYRQLAPGRRVAAENVMAHEILGKLRSREYGFALTLNDMSGEDVVSTLILDEPMLVLIGPTSHLRGQETLTMKQLDGAPLVTTSEEYSIGRLMRGYFSQTGTSYGLLQQVGDSDSIGVKVYNNFGISFVPEAVVNLWIKTPQLRIQGNLWIPMEDGCCRRRIYLTRLREDKPEAGCAAFLRYLERYAAAVRAEHAYPIREEMLPYLQEDSDGAAVIHDDHLAVASTGIVAGEE